MILSRGSYDALLKEIPKWKGNYLEIGVYEGDMLKDFAERWPDKTFYGIDPFISDKDTIGHTGVPIGERMCMQQAAARNNFHGISNIKFFLQTSKSFMEEQNDYDLDWMTVRVVYVDGNHSYDDTLNDLCLSARLIKGDGLIYVDDFNLPDVLMATQDFIGINGKRIEKYEGHRILLK